MQINKAEFRCSSERITQVPKDSLRDIAFIGRSNVGKSSLINMLTGRNGLAKVSGTPGKTRLINHFRIDDAWYLVDLPGYGYARTSKAVRGEFSKLIGTNGVPFGIVFTKADKLSKAQCEKSIERYRQTLAETWEELPPMFVSSSERGTGRDEILDFIGECLKV